MPLYDVPKDGCHCWTRTNAVSNVTALQAAAFAARRQVAIDGPDGGTRTRSGHC